MDEFRKYIEDNRAAFESDSLPQGHKGRFLDKVSRGDKKSVGFKTLLYGSVAIAASIAIIVFINSNIESRLSGEYYVNILNKQGMKIEKMAAELDISTYQVVESVLRELTYEAIPIANQLPSSLRGRDKIEIIDNYYTTKIEGISKLEKYVASLVKTN